MNNLPIVIKIEKSSIGGFTIKKYTQLNGVTKEVEVIFIKQKSKCDFESFYSMEKMKIIKDFLNMLSNSQFI